MDEVKRELTDFEKSLKRLEFQVVQGGDGSYRDGSPTYWQEQNESPRELMFKTDNSAFKRASPGPFKHSPEFFKTQHFGRDEQRSPSVSPSHRSPSVIPSGSPRKSQVDLFPYLNSQPNQKSKMGSDYDALSDFVDPDNSQYLANTKDVSALLGQPIKDAAAGSKVHAHNVIKIKALKLMDVYKQLQQAVFRDKKCPYDSFTVMPIVQDLRVLPQDAVTKLVNISPQHQQADSVLLDQKMLADENLTKVINSPQVHILSAFAIAEDEPDIFKRIVRFLSLKGWELPKHNGIYERQDWQGVVTCKSSFLNELMSEALQATIQMDWFLLCDTIINYAKSQQFFLSISSDSISALIENEAFDLMVALLQSNIFLAKKKMNPFKEHKANEMSDSAPNRLTKSVEPPALLNREVERSNYGQAKLKQEKQETHLPEDGQAAVYDDEYPSNRTQKKIKDLDDDNREQKKHEDLVKLLIKQKKPKTRPDNLLHGETPFLPYHIFEQLFRDKPELRKQDQPRHHKMQLHILIQRLYNVAKFSDCVPVLVLNGNREAVYQMLQSKAADKQPVTKKVKSTQLQVEEENGDNLLITGNVLLSQEVREQVALAFFCFSIGQEQLDEALNVFLKYPLFLRKNGSLCRRELLSSISYSAAFFGLKFYLLDLLLDEITSAEVRAFIDCFESKILTDFSPLHSHRALLLQNSDPLLVTLQTMTILKKLGKLEPKCLNRIDRMVTRLDEQLAEVLETADFKQLQEMESHVWLADIFERNVVAYLQELKPKATLDTAFCSRLLDGLWRSNYFTSNGTFFNFSTSYQIVKNQVITNHAGTPTIKYVCTRKGTSYPLQEFTLPIWQKSQQQRFIIDFCLVLALTITAQIFFFRLSSQFGEATVIYNAYMNSPKFNVEKFEATNGIISRQIFTDACVMIGAGFLVAIGYPCQKVLRHMYVRQTSLIVKSGTIEVVNVVLLASSTVVLAELLYFALNLKSQPTRVSFESTFTIYLVAEMTSKRPKVFSIAIAVMLATMWIKLMLMLQVTQSVGRVMLALAKMIKSIVIYVVMWLVCLLIFFTVILMLYPDTDGAQDHYNQFLSIIESILGNWEAGFPQYAGARLPQQFGATLHLIFLLINAIGILSILTAVFTDSYSRQKDNWKSRFNAYRIDLLPSQKYDDQWGWMILCPEVVSPLVLFFIYPFATHFCKCCCKDLKARSKKLSIVFFIPIALIYLLLFTLSNIILSPIAYFNGIYQTTKINSHQERFYAKATDAGTRQPTRATIIATWIFGGPFILMLSIIADSRLFLKDIFDTPATVVEERKEEQLNLPAFQKLYKVVSLQIVQTLFSPQQINGHHMTTRSVLHSVRKLLAIDDCIKQMTYGDIEKDALAKIQFIAGLLSDKQSENDRIQSYKAIRELVLKYRVDSDYVLTSKARSHEIRGGLLWQVLKEIKMQVKAALYKQQHAQDKNLQFIDFMTLTRDDAVERQLQAINVVCPTLVLGVLRKQSEQESRDRFRSELVRLQTKILKQQQVHILQSQVTKVISTTDSLARGFVKLDQSKQDNDNEIRASLDPAAKLDYYHGTLARQELIYTDITNLDVSPALAALYSYKITQPPVNLADLADLAAGSKDLTEAKEEVKVEQAITTPKPKKSNEKPEKTEKKEVASKGGKRAKSNDRKEAEESKKASRKSSKETSSKPSGQRKKSK